ncbi:Fc receptor-like protein, partial [Pimephales promelas]
MDEGLLCSVSWFVIVAAIVKLTFVMYDVMFSGWHQDLVLKNHRPFRRMTYVTHDHTLAIGYGRSHVKTKGLFDFMQLCADRSVADLKQCMPVRNFVRLDAALTPRDCDICHQSTARAFRRIQRVTTITVSSPIVTYTLRLTWSGAGEAPGLPTSTVTVTPAGPVFTGETVNLKCVINSYYSDWRYEWYKDRGSEILQTSDRYTVNRDTVTIRGATEYDQGQYWCKGQRDGRPNSSTSRSAVSLSVKDLPTSTVTVTPAGPVFTGETVNLKCVINSDHSDWRYEWYKDSVILQTSGRYTVNRDTVTIRGATEYDQGQYWCKGQRDGRPNSSTSRSAVSLSVKGLPTSTVTVTPAGPVFTGETVKLKCVINSYYSNWRYEWYKDSVKLQTYDRYTVNRDTVTIRGATESDQGQYWCKGQRYGRPNSSTSSSVVSLSVKGKPVVKVRPDQRVFIGERVTLTCDIQGGGNIQWRYSWIKDGNTVNPYTTTTTTAYYSFTASASLSGEYRCRGERSDSHTDFSDGVTLTVSDLPTSTVTVTPAGPVFTGETVNLQCVINSDHSNWRYEWYKDSVKLQTSDDRFTVNRDTLTIRGAIGSDQGQYWCKGRRDGRPNSSTSSSVVSLSVKGKPVVKVRPDQRVFRGERVTLTCDIQGGGNIQWTYRWIRDGNTGNPNITTTTAYYSFTADVSLSGKYSCRGERSDSYTESDALTLTVS